MSVAWIGGSCDATRFAERVVVLQVRADGAP